MYRVTVKPLDGEAPVHHLHVGAYWCREVPCQVEHSGEVGLPAEMMHQIGLVPGQQIHLFRSSDGRHLHLGPLVGIVMRQGPLTRLHTDTDNRYRRMAAAAQETGVLLLLLEQAEIDLGGGSVSGFLAQGDSWRKMRMPMPDLLYNRATFSDPVERQAASLLRRQLADQVGIPIFNPVAGFGKWRVCEALGFFDATASLVPQSMSMGDEDSFLAMLDAHPLLFVKAEFGSRGIDILQIKRTRQGWDLIKPGRRRHFAHPNRLFRHLLVQNASKHWMLQQGIALRQLDGRRYDFRVIVQKDRTGLWQHHLTLIRRAAVGQWMTSVSLGGEAMQAEKFAARFGHHVPEVQRIIEQADEISRLVAQVLESRYGLLGEVGTDIGFDEDGRPWLFEANTKPLHWFFSDLESPIVKPMGYAIWLAERQWAGRYSGLPYPSLI